MSELPSPSQLPAPAKHLMKAGTIQANRAARALRTVVGTARLAANGPDPVLMAEFSKLQFSILAHFRSLSETWATHWQDWFQYSTHVHGANTMSKLAERETNILGQMTQIMGNQITDLVNLQENIEINFAYLIEQKLRQEDSAQVSESSSLLPEGG